MVVCVTVCCGLRSRRVFSSCRFPRLPCVVFYCPVLRYNKRPAAAACARRLLLHRPLPPHPPLPPAFSLLLRPLCYFKWSGASWVLQCLSRACLVTYGGDGSPQKTTIPRVPPGPHQSIRLQHIRGDGVGGGVGRGEDLQRPALSSCN